MSAARNYKKATKQRTKRFTIENPYNRKDKHEKHTEMARVSKLRGTSR